jgi:hypothetical protein
MGIHAGNPRLHLCAPEDLHNPVYEAVVGH